MQKQKYRNSIFNSNRYQRKIIILPLVSTFILCSILTVLLVSLQQDIFKAVLYTKDPGTIEMINQLAILLIFYLWTFFMLITIISFTGASNLVGAFNRIIRDLNLIATGKKKSRIDVRKEDELASNLITKINLLIDKANNLEDQLS